MKKYLPLVILVFLGMQSCSMDRRLRCIEVDVETWTERMEIELQRAKKSYDEASVLNAKT